MKYNAPFWSIWGCWDNRTKSGDQCAHIRAWLTFLIQEKGPGYMFDINLGEK